MTAIDISSYAGLAAMVLLTLNVLLGLILSTRLNPLARWWPFSRRRIYGIHNWTAYAALSLVILHPTILLFSDGAGFRVLDLLFPISSPGQRLYNCFGAIAFYLLLFVVITSYLRKRMSFRIWKAFHFVSYATAAALFLHGILIDPNLKKLPPDLLDGEKVLIELCLLLVMMGSVLRWRAARSKVPVARLEAEF